VNVDDARYVNGHPTKKRRVVLTILTIATPQQQAALNKEDKLELALQAYQ